MATYVESTRRWVASVRYTDPVTGADKRKYLYGATEAEADARAAEFRATPPSEMPTGDRPSDVRMLLGRWLSEKDPELDRSAVAWTFTEQPVQRDQWLDYESVIRTHVLDDLGAIKLEALTHARLRRYFVDLAKKRSRRGGTLSVSTQRKVHSRLTSAFRYAVVRGWLPADPMAGIPTPSESVEAVGRVADLSPVERALTVPEMRRFERWIATRYADHLAYQVRWRLAFSVGLRQAELLGLTWDAIDLAARTITVRQQLRKTEHRHGCAGDWPDPDTSPCTVSARVLNPRAKAVTAYWCPQRIDAETRIVATTKSKRVRYVRVGEREAGMLAELYAQQHPVDAPPVAQRETQRLARSRAMRVYPIADADLVIRHPRGGHVTPAVDNAVWHAACEGAGVSSIGRDVHAARHTAATHLVAAGVPLTTVQAMLGHSTIAVTQRYVTTTRDTQDAALAQLDAHLASIEG
ncbi:tyrosine-type recombinase/integrase [Cellulomonas palmilytica]|uniref:tyrosine-type recombinase/integrase n=1 Tax=Cellulomonas palmilytica TaxID=2608402 RepID=UPI001F1EA835|nr:tyrosine-type recombinase/integrase [Cellulomonas palmilytica]UJP40785.1 tyrosine-type recombinase/integrase [Cellulomonas palmilytica]